MDDARTINCFNYPFVHLINVFSFAELAKQWLLGNSCRLSLPSFPRSLCVITYLTVKRVENAV